MPGTILDVIKERRSIRKFTAEPVPAEVIEKLAEAARWAPAPTNKQGFELIIVNSAETKRRLADAIKSELSEIRKKLSHEDAVDTFNTYARYFTFFEDAPTVVIVTYRIKSSIISVLQGGETGLGEEVAVLSGVGAAIQNMLLTLHSLGYGACWMTGPLIAETKLAKILQLKEPTHIAAVIPIGKPAENPVPPRRRDIDKIMRMVD